MVGKPISGESRRFTDKPNLSFSGTIEILEGRNSYIVDGTVDSFAIVIDYDETQTVSYYYGYPNTYKSLTMLTFENIGYIFCEGDYSDTPLTIILAPNDEVTYSETKFEFSTNRDSTQYIYAEYGKFYKLHPQKNGLFQTFGWRIPSFEEGIVGTGTVFYR